MGRCTHGDAQTIPADDRSLRPGIGAVAVAEQAAGPASVDAISATPRSPGAPTSSRRWTTSAAVGFHGDSARGEAFAQFGDRPRRCASCSSSETPDVRGASRAATCRSIRRASRRCSALHVSTRSSCTTAADCICRSSTSGRRAVPLCADDYTRLGRLLTELGEADGESACTLVYHHHMNSTGEKPNESARGARRRGPSARAAAVRRRALPAGRRRSGRARFAQYREWIEVVHLKDVRPARQPGADYQFVELGRGRVDLPGVFAALRGDRLQRLGDRRARSRAGAGAHSEGIGGNEPAVLTGVLRQTSLSVR